MKSVIIGIENCPKCDLLKAICPDAEVVIVNPAEILAFARKVGITSMPFVVSVGSVTELEKVLKND